MFRWETISEQTLALKLGLTVTVGGPCAAPDPGLADTQRFLNFPDQGKSSRMRISFPKIYAILVLTPPTSDNWCGGIFMPPWASSLIFRLARI